MHQSDIKLAMRTNLLIAVAELPCDLSCLSEAMTTNLSSAARSTAGKLFFGMLALQASS